MLRPLRPRHGQLRRLPSSLRLRVPRPQRRLGFAPRLAPEDFKAAFTAAEGWGSYQQQIDNETKTLRATIELKWGQLRLRSLDLSQPFDAPPATVAVSVDGRRVDADIHHAHGQISIALAADVLIARRPQS